MKYNSKVRNATPLVYDDIKFKSRLEVYCYQKLKESNIKAEYESVKFVLLPSFSYNEKKFQKMTYTPDFVGTTFIIECKGYMNDVFPVKWKLFNHHLLRQKLDYDLYLPRNKKDIDNVIISILNGRTNTGRIPKTKKSIRTPAKTV